MSDSENIRKIWNLFESFGEEYRDLNKTVMQQAPMSGEFMVIIDPESEYEGTFFTVPDMASAAKLIKADPTKFEVVSRDEVVDQIGIYDPSTMPSMDHECIDRFVSSGELELSFPDEMDESAFAGRSVPTFGRKGLSATGPNPKFDAAVDSFENYIIMRGTRDRDGAVQFAAREHGIDPTDLKMELIKRKAYDMEVPSRELRDSADAELKSFKDHLAEVLAKGKK